MITKPLKTRLLVTLVTTVTVFATTVIAPPGRQGVAQAQTAYPHPDVFSYNSPGNINTRRATAMAGIRGRSDSRRSVRHQRAHSRSTHRHLRRH